MKKFILILGLMMTFNAKAYAGTISLSGSCGTTDADCHYDLYDDGHLEISGTGEMKDYSGNADSRAPWGTDIKTIAINGITRIGAYAFLYASNLQDVKISDTVKRIDVGAFEGTGFNGTLVIPESVKEIGTFVFSWYGNGTIVVEGNPKLNGASFVHTQDATIYCQKNLDCLNKGVWNGTDSSGGIVSYTKEGGVYIPEDGNMYASASDMAESKNECDDLLVCKAQVLKNKGYCADDETCAAIVNSDHANTPIEYKNKFYASIDDLLKGKYLPKRIYTIDEANAVAGKVNSVKIRYR